LYLVNTAGGRVVACPPNLHYGGHTKRRQRKTRQR
jgi:hypothetical protein